MFQNEEKFKFHFQHGIVRKSDIGFRWEADGVQWDIVDDRDKGGDAWLVGDGVYGDAGVVYWVNRDKREDTVFVSSK